MNINVVIQKDLEALGLMRVLGRWLVMRSRPGRRSGIFPLAPLAPALRSPPPSRTGHVVLRRARAPLSSIDYLKEGRAQCDKTRIHRHTHTHTRARTRTHTYTHTHRHTRTRRRTHTHTREHTHTHIHAHTQIHIDVCVCVCVCPVFMCAPGA